MAKEDTITLEGVVLERMPDGGIRVEIARDHQVIARASAKFRARYIQLETGTRVQVEMSLHDMNRGRLV
jgi:translation initiation factor IF-1